MFERTRNFFVFWRFRRLLAWLPVIWNDAEFDHSYLFRIMEFKLRRMAWYQRKYGHHVCSERTAQQQTEAAALCRRMANEDYPISSHDEYLRDAAYRQDLDRLLLLFRKYVRTWWD